MFKENEPGSQSIYSVKLINSCAVVDHWIIRYVTVFTSRLFLCLTAFYAITPLLVCSQGSVQWRTNNPPVGIDATNNGLLLCR
jgi:hypothetical protein